MAIAIIERIVREEWGQVLSILVAQLRDIQLAEDALQDALVLALERWPAGIPDNPCGWLLQVAKRKMIDQVRRRESLRGKQDAILASLKTDAEAEMPEPNSIPDERLRLIFTCCHPALAEEARVALTLQTLGGLTTPEIARAFLISEPTMAQRLVRVKRKIKTARIPYEVPDSEHLGDRQASVLAVVYLIFNEGYSASSGENPIRADLCDEAIRLARMLVGLMPRDAETKGLLALMLLHHSRSDARIGAGGEFVRLQDQNRGSWDRDKINMGLVILEDALAGQSPGPYQLQAAISALHAQAPDHESTDWRQIYQLYERLHALHPSPVIRLNAIVALSYAEGPEVALQALAELRGKPKLQNYLPLHAAEADFQRRIGNSARAIAAYERAIAVAGNESERAFFQKQIQQLPRTP